MKHSTLGIKLVVLLGILSLSSNTQISVSKVKIIFYKGKRPLNYLTSNKTIISACKELVIKSKSTNAVNCDTTGEILYLDINNKTVLKVYFSTKATNSKYAAPAIRFNKITSLMTYQAGMDLDEIFYDLNK